MSACQPWVRREGMAPMGAVKVLLATGPRALLRSTLTAPISAKDAPLSIAGENCSQLKSSAGE